MKGTEAAGNFVFGVVRQTYDKVLYTTTLTIAANFISFSRSLPCQLNMLLIECVGENRITLLVDVRAFIARGLVW